MRAMVPTKGVTLRKVITGNTIGNGARAHPRRTIIAGLDDDVITIMDQCIIMIHIIRCTIRCTSIPETMVLVAAVAVQAADLKTAPEASMLPLAVVVVATVAAMEMEITLCW